MGQRQSYDRTPVIDMMRQIDEENLLGPEPVYMPTGYGMPAPDPQYFPSPSGTLGPELQPRTDLRPRMPVPGVLPQDDNPFAKWERILGQAPSQATPEMPKPTIGGALKQWAMDKIPGYGPMRMQRQAWEQQNARAEGARQMQQWQHRAQAMQPYLAADADTIRDEQKRQKMADFVARNYGHVFTPFEQGEIVTGHNLPYRSHQINPLRGMKDVTYGGKPMLARFQGDEAGNISWFGPGNEPLDPRLIQQEAKEYKTSLPERYQALEQKRLAGMITPEEEMERKSIDSAMLLGSRYVQGEVGQRFDTGQLQRSFEARYKNLNDPLTKMNDQSDRMGRLIASLNSGTAVADQLIAPELLSAMGGGLGSGLRMSEAEISRIVSSRGAWDELGIALNRFKTDPNAVRFLSKSQIQAINGLVGEVNRKLQTKRQMYVDAMENLIDAKNPEEQRRIIVKLNQDLINYDKNSEDAAKAQGGGWDKQKSEWPKWGTVNGKRRLFASEGQMVPEGREQEYLGGRR